MKPNRKSYPSDVSEEEWSFCAPYLTLMKEGAPQRDHPLREVFNALRWFVRAGCPWRMMPNDLPPWHVDQSRILQSTPESGERAGFDGHKKRKGSKVHAAVDTLGHLLALRVTPANEQDRAQIGVLAKEIQEV